MRFWILINDRYYRSRWKANYVLANCYVDDVKSNRFCDYLNSKLEQFNFKIKFKSLESKLDKEKFKIQSMRDNVHTKDQFDL